MTNNGYIPKPAARVTLRDQVLSMLRNGSALTATEIAGRASRRNSHISNTLKILSEEGLIDADTSTGVRRWRLRAAPK